jgi:oligopeptidase A
MEYWLFETKFLSHISKHYETGESLSDTIIKKLQHQRQSSKRNELLQRLFLSELELGINSPSTFDPNGDESIIAIQRNYAERYCPNQIPPKGNIDPLIHIFQSNANGKLSMQYRYLWSEVMSADIFSIFQETMTNEVNVEGEATAGKGDVRELGKKFRKTFLEAGGSVSTEDTFTAFRGKKVKSDALLKSYGFLR